MVTYISELQHQQLWERGPGLTGLRVIERDIYGRPNRSIDPYTGEEYIVRHEGAPAGSSGSSYYSDSGTKTKGKIDRPGEATALATGGYTPSIIRGQFDTPEDIIARQEKAGLFTREEVKRGKGLLESRTAQFATPERRQYLFENVIYREPSTKPATEYEPYQDVIDEYTPEQDVFKEIAGEQIRKKAGLTSSIPDREIVDTGKMGVWVKSGSKYDKRRTLYSDVSDIFKNIDQKQNDFSLSLYRETPLEATNIAKAIDTHIERGSKITNIFEKTTGISNTRLSFGKEGYEFGKKFTTELIDKPITAGTSLVIGGITGRVAKIAVLNMKLFPMATWGLKSKLTPLNIVGGALTGIYGVDVITRVMASQNKAGTLGGITSTEILPMGLGYKITTSLKTPSSNLKQTHKTNPIQAFDKAFNPVKKLFPKGESKLTKEEFEFLNPITFKPPTITSISKTPYPKSKSILTKEEFEFLNPIVLKPPTISTPSKTPFPKGTSKLTTEEFEYLNPITLKPPKTISLSTTPFPKSTSKLTKEEFEYLNPVTPKPPTIISLAKTPFPKGQKQPYTPKSQRDIFRDIAGITTNQEKAISSKYIISGQGLEPKKPFMGEVKIIDIEPKPLFRKDLSIDLKQKWKSRESQYRGSSKSGGQIVLQKTIQTTKQKPFSMSINELKNIGTVQPKSILKSLTKPTKQLPIILLPQLKSPKKSSTIIALKGFESIKTTQAPITMSDIKLKDLSITGLRQYQGMGAKQAQKTKTTTDQRLRQELMPKQATRQAGRTKLKLKIPEIPKIPKIKMPSLDMSYGKSKPIKTLDLKIKIVKNPFITLKDL